MIRVLVVDDSALAVAALERILALDPEFSIVGVARDGEQAVALAGSLRPDVITMDLQMPVMNGYEATQRIMQEHPTPIVVIAAAASAVDESIGFDALRCGAVDIIDKPVDLTRSVEEIADEFHRRLRIASKVRPIRRVPRLQRRVASAVGATLVGGIVAIGASTGGPPAIEAVLCGLPSPFPLPIVVVQHMSKGFTAGLARWLAQATAHSVVLATDGIRLKPGTVYVAPEDRHLTVGPGNVVTLEDGPHVEGMRPAVDVTFNSVAARYGDAAIGVLLSGMGRDGAAGLKQIRDCAGRTFVQDRASCAVFGMPREAIGLRAADVETPLGEIARAIVDATRTRRS